MYKHKIKSNEDDLEMVWSHEEIKNQNSDLLDERKIMILSYEIPNMALKIHNVVSLPNRVLFLWENFRTEMINKNEKSKFDLTDLGPWYSL